MTVQGDRIVAFPLGGGGEKIYIVDEYTRATNNKNLFSHSYRASWYYQSFIYSPPDALVSCIKKTILKFTLKQFWHVYCNIA